MRGDEIYILNLCDEVLGLKSRRQHFFPFLRGTTGRMLPVDAFYPEIKLVIEYRERQHREAVPFFDGRQTVSGVPRGIQRALYDQLRREVLPRNNITLVELNVCEFPHSGRKRLKRIREKDIEIICKCIKIPKLVV